ncbi:hypothetical protein FQN53_001382 [Emmonsiellopsis sp. PD_33]|nr:hypothetical protein FQN53_001382 [Emmonsiellopsis sp. PD_33]
MTTYVRKAALKPLKCIRLLVNSTVTAAAARPGYVQEAESTLAKSATRDMEYGTLHRIAPSNVVCSKKVGSGRTKTPDALNNSKNASTYSTVLLLSDSSLVRFVLEFSSNGRQMRWCSFWLRYREKR